MTKKEKLEKVNISKSQSSNFETSSAENLETVGGGRGSLESEFFSKLSNATNEPKDVNPVYIGLFEKYWNNKSGNSLGIFTVDSNAYSSDGVLSCYYTSDDGIQIPYVLLIECKLKGYFSDNDTFANVLVQALYYAKKIKNDGTKNYTTPKVIVLGSRDGCAVVSLSGKLLTYLDKNFKARSASRTPSEDKDIVTTDRYI